MTVTYLPLTLEGDVQLNFQYIENYGVFRNPKDGVVTGGSPTYAGPPTVGYHTVGDSYIDSNGVSWICTSSGQPGTWAAQVGAWTDYVPTVAPTSGAITSENVPTCSYLRIGGLCVVQYRVNLVTVGTASGDLTVSFPTNFTSSGVSTGLSRENAVTGKVAFTYCDSGGPMHMYGNTLDNTSSWVNGYGWATNFIARGTWS